MDAENDPNILAFTWKGQRYEFKWGQVVVGPSLDILKAVALRRRSVYRYDVFELFQFAGIVYPAECSAYIVQTWGFDITGEMLRHPPLPEEQPGADALLKLDQWLTKDERAVAQYYAARYINRMADFTPDSWTPMHICLTYFESCDSAYQLARSVYLRFFAASSPNTYNETLETVYVLMCHMGTRVRHRIRHEQYIDLDNDNWSNLHPWENASICKDVYRAMILFKARLGSRLVIPADSSHRYRYYKRRKQESDTYVRRIDLLHKLFHETPELSDKLVPSNSTVARLMSYFLWCFLMGAAIVQAHSQAPTPFVQFD